MYASTSAFLVCSFLGFFLPSVAVVPQFHGKQFVTLAVVELNKFNRQPNGLEYSCLSFGTEGAAFCFL